MNKKIICLDFDGVIHSYKSGWKGARVITDPPVPGALEFIVEATKHFQVAIYSSRSGYWFGRRAMKRWLKDEYAKLSLTWDDTPAFFQEWFLYTGTDVWDEEVERAAHRLVKEIQFPTKKPPAFIGLDDRVLQFTGTFPDPHTLIHFKPWNKRKDI